MIKVIKKWCVCNRRESRRKSVKKNKNKIKAEKIECAKNKKIRETVVGRDNFDEIQCIPRINLCLRCMSFSFSVLRFNRSTKQISIRFVYIISTFCSFFFFLKRLMRRTHTHDRLVLPRQKLFIFKKSNRHLINRT